jgi:hypothetical protein
MDEACRLASEIQAGILRSMTGAQRLALALRMSHLSRSLAIAGLRERHPEWSDDRIMAELVGVALPRRGGPS